MGGQSSKPSYSSSNPSSNSPVSDMSSSNSSQTHESNHEKEQSHVLESPETQGPVKVPSNPPAEEEAPADMEIKEDEAAVTPEGEKGKEGEEEEEGECGFCLFMKGGGCRDEFIEWEKCVEEGEKNQEDIAERCFEITGNLKKCMEAHRDYYEPLLAAEENAMKELEEKGKEIEERANESEKREGSDEELGSEVEA